MSVDPKTLNSAKIPGSSTTDKTVVTNRKEREKPGWRQEAARAIAEVYFPGIKMSDLT
jgi:hypothetical protein